jgi:hypothetical protein
LGFAAIGLFIAPIVLAIVVGLCAGGNDAAKFTGALIGLGLGVGASFLCVRLILGGPEAGAQASAARTPGKRWQRND